MDNKELTLDQSFKELEKVLSDMQTQDISLEKSFELYKKGIELVKQCNDKIEKIECDIKKLNPGEM